MEEKPLERIETQTKIKLPDGRIIEADQLTESERTAYIEFAIHLAAPAIARFLNGVLPGPNTLKVEKKSTHDSLLFKLPPVLTVKEAAEVLRVSEATVREMINRYDGRFFPHIRMGVSAVRIPRDEFIEWLNKGGIDHYKEEKYKVDEEYYLKNPNEYGARHFFANKYNKRHKKDKE